MLAPLSHTSRGFAAAIPVVSVDQQASEVDWSCRIVWSLLSRNWESLPGQRSRSNRCKKRPSYG